MTATNRRSSTHAPAGGVATLGELVGVAHAMEVEAIDRYRWLAGQMRRRGETEAAEAFTAMAEEEEDRVEAVEGWAAELGEPLPPAQAFAWRLPRALAEGWEEAAGSARLTPYRAYAVAVDNEERAFAFYSHLASAADDAQVAREAEHLALEELRHAALLRIWRRAAWRRENGKPRDGSQPGGPEALARLLARREAEIANCHRLLALRLRALGDGESALLLEELAAEAAARAVSGNVRALCLAEVCGGEQPLGMMFAAQRPLERLCEQLEDLHLGASSAALQSMAETFLADAVARIARLGRRIEDLESR